MIARLAMALAPSLALPCQLPLSPVPATGSVTCAWSCGWQEADAYVSCDAPMCPPSERWRFDPGECWVAAYCDAADIRVGMPPGSINIPIAVRIGAPLYWQTINARPGTAAPYQLGEVATMFAFSRYTSDEPTAFAPWAATGWNAIFGADHIIMAPQFFAPQPVGAAVIDSEVVCTPIPFTATLVGAYLQCQGARFDPDGRFYLSAAMLAQIGN